MAAEAQENYSLEELGRMPRPYMQAEKLFRIVDGEARFLVETIASLERRLDEHERRRDDQKQRLKALIESQLPTNGHGEITALRLRQVLEAIVADL